MDTVHFRTWHVFIAHWVHRQFFKKKKGCNHNLFKSLPYWQRTWSQSTISWVSAAARRLCWRWWAVIPPIETAEEGWALNKSVLRSHSPQGDMSSGWLSAQIQLFIKSPQAVHIPKKHGLGPHERQKTHPSQASVVLLTSFCIQI